MTPTKRVLSVALLAAAFFLVRGIASAQETPAASTPMPAASPTLMDRAYDGGTHVTLAPYVWLPTIRTNLTYTIPKLPTGAGGAVATNVQVGPSDYLTNLNSAGMLAFNVRKGNIEFMGDYIFLNLSSNATFNTTFTGPVGRVRIPAQIVTNSRFASSIWELAAGLSLAHGHNADINFFTGWRQLPITTNLSYTATIGSAGRFSRAGTVKITPLANDVVFGFNGKVFAGDHFFAPYYIDMGVGATQQTWQGYTGVGYAFNHGQTIVATIRTLNYYGFSSSSPVQKVNMWGPLFGYTFGL